jgi:hypothetical protein
MLHTHTHTHPGMYIKYFQKDTMITESVGCLWRGDLRGWVRG